MVDGWWMFYTRICAFTPDDDEGPEQGRSFPVHIVDAIGQLEKFHSSIYFVVLSLFSTFRFSISLLMFIYRVATFAL